MHVKFAMFALLAFTCLAINSECYVIGGLQPIAGLLSVKCFSILTNLRGKTHKSFLIICVLSLKNFDLSHYKFIS